MLEPQTPATPMTDALNTTAARGQSVFNRLASLAALEQGLIRERAHARLASARTRGRGGSRRKVLSAEAERTAIVA